MDADSFTYGIELEGVFNYLTLDKLIGMYPRKIEKKSDGSVRSNDIRRMFPACYNYNTFPQEINAGVFKTQKEVLDLLGELRAFKDHFFDKSCGLHLHIKPKRNARNVRARIFDFGFLRDVEKYAYTNLCEHVKARRRNRYCLPDTNIYRTVREIREGSKYKFMRNHTEHGTLEFRFFSPCEHKAENIKMFMDYFIARLGDVKNGKKSITRIKRNVNFKELKLEQYVKCAVNVYEDRYRKHPWERDSKIVFEHTHKIAGCATDIEQEFKIEKITKRNRYQ